MTTQISERIIFPSTPRATTASVVAVRTLPLTDTISVVACLLVAHFIRFGDESGTLLVGATAIDYSVVSAGTAVIWSAALYLFRPRSPLAFARSDEDYRSAIRASVVVFTIFSFLTIAFHLEPSRAYLLYVFPAGTLTVLLTRFLWRRRVRRSRSTDAGTRNVLLIGTREEAARFADGLASAQGPGLRLVGARVTDEEPQAAVSDSDWLGELRRTIHDDEVAAVVVGSLPTGREVSLRTLAWTLEDSGAQLLLAPELESVTSSRLSVLEVAGAPVILVEQPQFAGEKYLYKRVLDLVVACLGLVVAVPVIAVAALATWLHDGAGPFFRQQRVGVGGRLFWMYKLRSMSVGADAVVEKLADANEAGGPLFKMRDDPRVTRVGRFLRRYSIDELPQIVNVIRGDMSIVGPRPPLPIETEQYETWAHRRMLVKPGLTGLWQVSGRSDLDWEEGLLLDLGYVENWSVFGDLTIIAKTVRAVFAHRGAY